MAKRFYFAYGANTHREHMADRCPAAKAVGRVKLGGHRLAFRGVADVVRDPSASVRGVLWEITAECERALDRFEGFPRLYVKRTATLKLRGEVVRIMFYVMREKGDRFSPPPRSYESTLRTGYGHFGVKTEQIDAAIVEARKSDGEPPFVSKWHRIDRDGEDVKPVGRVPAKAHAKLPPSRTPVPASWEQWRFDSFDERLRAARARPLPNPPAGRVIRSNVDADAAMRRDAKLLAEPIGSQRDFFSDIRERLALRRGDK